MESEDYNRARKLAMLILNRTLDKKDLSHAERQHVQSIASALDNCGDNFYDFNTVLACQREDPTQRSNYEDAILKMLAPHAHEPRFPLFGDR